jgi:hypothetical protein
MIATAIGKSKSANPIDFAKGNHSKSPADLGTKVSTEAGYYCLGLKARRSILQAPAKTLSSTSN